MSLLALPCDTLIDFLDVATKDKLYIKTSTRITKDHMNLSID